MFIFGDGNKIEKVNGVTIGTFVYSEGVFVVEVDNRLFLVMNKKINNSIDNKSNKSKPTRNIDDFAEKIIKNRISFGGEDSFIEICKALRILLMLVPLILRIIILEQY